MDPAKPLGPVLDNSGDGPHLPPGVVVTPLNPGGPIANRITLQLSVVHELVGEQPKPIQGTYSTELELDEEHYTRRFTVGQEWLCLPKGHLGPDNSIGLLVVENLEGKNYQVKPDAAEKEACKLRVVEVRSFDDDLVPILVRPTGYQPLVYSDFAMVMLRCQSGNAKVRTTIFPR